VRDTTHPWTCVDSRGSFCQRPCSFSYWNWGPACRACAPSLCLHRWDRMRHERLNFSLAHLSSPHPPLNARRSTLPDINMKRAHAVTRFRYPLVQRDALPEISLRGVSPSRPWCAHTAVTSTSTHVPTTPCRHPRPPRHAACCTLFHGTPREPRRPTKYLLTGRASNRVAPLRGHSRRTPLRPRARVINGRGDVDASLQWRHGPR
jgi:hypothetical protein